MHTPADHATLTAAGIDPDTVQPRERPVPCAVCFRPTLNVAAGCDRPGHYQPPALALAAGGVS